MPAAHEVGGGAGNTNNAPNGRQQGPGLVPGLGSGGKAKSRGLHLALTLRKTSFRRRYLSCCREALSDRKRAIERQVVRIGEKFALAIASHQVYLPSWGKPNEGRPCRNGPRSFKVVSGGQAGAPQTRLRLRRRGARPRGGKKGGGGEGNKECGGWGMASERERAGKLDFRRSWAEQRRGGKLGC